MAQWTSINVEGGLFPADILDTVAAGTADGQRPADFQLEETRLLDELQGAFADARSFWDAFRRRAARTAADTSLTRQAWVIPLLERLGFSLDYQAAALSAGNGTYTISHLHGSEPRTPVHIVAFDQELDKRDAIGRRSPHALLQEYLNRSDSLWGLVTNGHKLRLLRDTERMAKPSYVEFDLEGMIESDKYSEFALLYRLLHATRFPLPGSDPAKCWLETYYQQGNDLGGRVRDGMRDGVSAALETLGNAFLKHEDNNHLRDAFRSGRLGAEQYYRQLLRLVYRFLFLMVTEERRLVFPEEEAGSPGHLIYDRYYSISRLRDRAERYYAEDRHYDLWEGVKSTFALFREDALARKLGLRALNGELFGESACADLEAGRCFNADLLRAVRELSTYRQQNGPRRRVNFRDIDVEEFGSVYESLLDYHPVVDVEERSFAFLTGNERKSTGSYYTPSSLVQELIQSALVPVLEERVQAARTRDEKAEAIISMRVIDPAAGSGHFLLAAARRMARELARVRTDEAEPPVEDYRRALRDVIRNCLYAVDKNPLAVDLCKVALWIEGHNAGLPLGFLDNHIKLGDSLVGVFDLAVLKAGIPDEAYKPVTGDDKGAARGFRDRNRQEKKQAQLQDGGYQSGLGVTPVMGTEQLAPDFAALGELTDDTPADVHAKEDLYSRLRSGEVWMRFRTACDLWTYAFFAPLRPDTPFKSTVVPTHAALARVLRGAHEVPVESAAMGFSQEHPFFHWPLEFPDVFADGGFDVVLGNPPFGNAIEGSTARNEKATIYFSHVFDRIARGAYDNANLFFGRALQVVKNQGTLGMICPRATASGKSSASLREELDVHAPIQTLWCPDDATLFGNASVFVCLIAARKGVRAPLIQVSTDPPGASFKFREVKLPPVGSSYTWWELLTASGNKLDISSDCIPLDKAVEMWAGCTTGVAYELAPLVHEADKDQELRLVTTGAIDRFKCRWGTTRIRYLKRDYDRPVWPEQGPNGVLRARDKQRRPKLIVAGLSRVIETILDEWGNLGGVVSTHIVLPLGGSEQKTMLATLAVLNSAIFSFLFFERFGAKQMSGGNCTIGKSELGQIPVPPELRDGLVDLDSQLEGDTERLRIWRQVITLTQDLIEKTEDSSWIERDHSLHALISSLYGLSSDQHKRVYEWWAERALKDARTHKGESAESV